MKEPTVLLVIDFINDIVHCDGKIASSAKFVKEHHVIEHANQAIAFARQRAIPIIFIKIGFNANYLACPNHSPLYRHVKKHNALLLNTWGTEFHETLNLQSNDLIILKHRVNAFYATQLEVYLRANSITNVLITGVSTDLAIQTTARDAHDRDYKAFVIKDACGASSKELHENTLLSLQEIATLINTDDLNSVCK